jgi:CDP-paratose 2-epimerase
LSSRAANIPHSMKIIVTGACGFIGTSLTRRLLEKGFEVVGIDNLSRPGSEMNLEDLRGRRFTMHRLDVSDSEKTFEAFQKIGPVDAVFHLAAQVAVTTSYVNRYTDFRDNGVASFNVIESVKRHTPGAYCLYASTNKVYGNIEVSKPVGSNTPANPYTPYGVSKYIGELYFTEYGRKEIGLTTCSLRQSCIYGHHQFGMADQGWLVWFTIANLLDIPVTIYGDGKQVRDVLYVEDLIDLYLEAWQRRLTGAWPVGGGEENAISLQQGFELIERATGKKFAPIRHDKVRPGDQPYFVADCSWTDKAGFQWQPKTSVEDGLKETVSWLKRNIEQVRQLVEN